MITRNEQLASELRIALEVLKICATHEGHGPWRDMIESTLKSGQRVLDHNTESDEVDFNLDTEDTLS